MNSFIWGSNFTIFIPERSRSNELRSKFPFFSICSVACSTIELAATYLLWVLIITTFLYLLILNKSRTLIITSFRNQDRTVTIYFYSFCSAGRGHHQRTSTIPWPALGLVAWVLLSDPTLQYCLHQNLLIFSLFIFPTSWVTLPPFSEVLALMVWVVSGHLSYNWV